MFDTNALPATSSKKILAWRETRLGFLLLQADGQIAQGHRLAEKRELLDRCGPDDRLLVIRMQQFPTRPEVSVVDYVDAARSAIA